MQKRPDYFYITLVAVIVVFGLVMLSSASSAVSYSNFGDNYWHLKHQIFFGFLPGLLLFYLLSKIDYRFWKRIYPAFLVITIIILVSVFIPGIGATYGRTRSWVNVLGMSLQPSEVAKLTFLIFLAGWLGKRRDEERIGNLFLTFLPFVAALGAIVFLIAIEPDTGTLFVISIIAISVYFSAGASFSHLGLIGAAGALMFFILVKVAPYRTARLMTFLHPELDPQGIGYHINQALLAIGSGGFFGLGLGLSRQKFQYLPEVVGDSIFAVIAEELGFIFVVSLVVAFVFLAIRGYKIAKEAPDSFGRLLAVGITSWFVLQAFINIGAMLGLMPLTGVPLPFISYGGTALTTCLAAAGLMVNISKNS